MNYRHIFHAGCRCDVVKHAVLTLVLRHMRSKDKGFTVLDTHAGMGLYDLNDSRAQKTGEAEEGIKSLLKTPVLPDLAEYYAILHIMNPLWNGEDVSGFRVYPGSPLFAFHMLREQDRLIVCELHPDDANALRLQMPVDPRAQIHCRDGYEALGAFLPPSLKRGLALIDPPYEQPDEFDTIVKHVSKSYRRWPTGIFIIWYPIKDRPAIWKFHEALATAGIAKILCAEFVYEEDVSAGILGGSGLVVINPPWKLDKELAVLLPALHQAMDTAHKDWTVKWIVD